MTVVIVTLHIVAALLLIVVVLIQRGQGADIGASFGGGGAQTLFGSRGSGSFLGKLTGGNCGRFHGYQPDPGFLLPAKGRIHRRTGDTAAASRAGTSPAEGR